jgi:cell division protein FtsB
MLALAFWVGVLSERVKTLQVSVRELRAEDADPEGKQTKITRLQVQMEGVQTTLDKLDRSVQGMQRQVGNLMQGRGVREFRADIATP